MKGPAVLITGGAGFLGRALLAELAREDAPLRPGRIRALDLAPDPSSFPEGVEVVRGDVRDEWALERAARGVDLVVHLAALIDWGQHPPALVREVNVEGTRRVIAACRKEGVRGLVATSSLDAIFAGDPIHLADESWPYPDRFPAEYGASKAAAERLVLAADGPELRTIVLRPCSIWGPGDPYHVEPMIRQAVGGRLPRVGGSSPPSQWTHVDNAAHALALAGRAVLQGDEEACGELYFVTDYPPRHMFDQYAPILREVGVEVLPWGIPRPVLEVAARASTAAARWLRPLVRLTPTLTPASVAHLCSEFTVSTDKAERLLGYRPRMTEEEAYRGAIEDVRRRG